jgi:rubrerythrin
MKASPTLVTYLTRSMSEEQEAAHKYRLRASAALRSGHPELSKLWEHIAHEEDVHRAEFSRARDKARASK